MKFNPIISQVSDHAAHKKGRNLGGGNWPTPFARVVKFICLCVCFIVAIPIIALVGVYAYLSFYGSIELNDAKQSLIYEMQRNFPQYRLQIKTISLAKNHSKGGWFKLGLTGFSAEDLQGAKVANVPKLDIHFKTLPLFLGRLDPTGIFLRQAKLKLVQNENGAWEVPSLETNVDKQRVNPSQAQADWLGKYLSNIRHFLAGQTSLTKIGLGRATLTLVGQKAVETWDVESLSFRAADGAGGDLTGRGIAKRRNWKDKKIKLSIACLKKNNALQLRMDVKDLKPSDISVNLPILASLDSLSSQLSGQLLGELGANGEINFLRTKIAIGQGRVYPKGGEGIAIFIDGGTIDLEYQSDLGQLKIYRADFAFPRGYASFKGVGGFLEANDGRPAAWDFDLSMIEGHLGKLDQETIVPIDQMEVAGRYEPKTANVLIKNLSLKIDEATLKLKQKTRKNKPILVGEFGQIDKTLMMRVWPNSYGERAKQWVKTHVKQGHLQNGQIIIFDLDKERPNFLLRSDIINVVMPPLAGWPDLKAPVMQLEIHNDRLTVKTARASLGEGKNNVVGVRNAKFQIPDFYSKEKISEIHFDVKGEMWPVMEKASLSLFGADLKQLPVLSKIDGTVDGTVKLLVPFHKTKSTNDAFKIDGDFTLENLKGTVDRFQLGKGRIKFKLSEKALTIGGGALLDKIPTKIRWHYIYDTKKEEAQPIRFEARLPEAKLAAYNVDLSSLISSDVPVELSIRPFSKKRDRLYIKANLTDAHFALGQLGWEKLAGVPSFADFYIVPTDKGTLIENFNIRGDKLNAMGDLTLDKKGQLSRIDMSQVSYDLISNFSLKGVRGKDKSWSYDLQGRNFDVRPFFQSFLSGSLMQRRSSKRQNISINGKFSKVLGQNKVQLNDVTFNLSRRNGRLNRLFINGQFPSRAKLKGNLVAALTKAPILEITTDDAGQALRMAGVYTGMVRGQGRLSLQFNPARSLTSMRGRLDVSRFGLRQDTVLTELVSPEDIRKNKLTQQGVMPFDRLSMPFAIGQKQMVVHRSFINGPALGATIQGTLDYGRRRVQLSGTYVPLYGLNSILGNVPILGQLLVGRKEEGIVGITYGVIGSMNNPQVIVNPVSILAPGVLRQIFEFQQEKPRIKRRKTTVPPYRKQIAPR